MEDFDLSESYDSETWVVMYSDASGYPDQFLKFCIQKIEDADLPNVDYGIVDMTSGGWFSKETTPMAYVRFQKSALEKMGIWFRAQRFGNLVVFSMYKCIKKGFFDAVTGKTKAEVLAGIRASMTSNLAEIEEFDCLDLFGGLIFRQAKNNFDNEDEKNLS